MADKEIQYIRHKEAFRRLVNEFFETDNLQLIPEICDVIDSIACVNDTNVQELRSGYFIHSDSAILDTEE